MEQPPSRVEKAVDFLSASRLQVVPGKFDDIQLPLRINIPLPCVLCTSHTPKGTVTPITDCSRRKNYKGLVNL